MPPVLITTWRSIATPRRAIPIALVSTPMIVAQAQSTSHPGGVPVALAMCIAFVLVGPASWRALVAHRTCGPRLVAYAGIGAAVVVAVGAVVPRALGMPSTLLTANTSLVVELALFCVGGWGLGRDIELSEGLRRALERAGELERQAEHAQLLAMRAHLDPHFLFNTLNAIAEWCRDDAEAAERAIVELASLLRDVLSAVRTPTWPLERELALVSRLWSLHQLRDPGRFDVRWRVCPRALTAPVPAMLLLPLAENAMTHGPAAGHRGPVDLTVTSTPAAVTIELANPGAYHPAARAPSRGSPPVLPPGPATRDGRPGGIAMVVRRLDSAHGARATLAVLADADRTRVRIDLPVTAVAA